MNFGARGIKHGPQKPPDQGGFCGADKVLICAAKTALIWRCLGTIFDALRAPRLIFAWGGGALVHALGAPNTICVLFHMLAGWGFLKYCHCN